MLLKNLQTDGRSIRIYKRKVDVKRKKETSAELPFSSQIIDWEIDWKKRTTSKVTMVNTRNEIRKLSRLVRIGKILQTYYTRENFGQLFDGGWNPPVATLSIPPYCFLLFPLFASDCLKSEHEAAISC